MNKGLTILVIVATFIVAAVIGYELSVAYGIPIITRTKTIYKTVEQTMTRTVSTTVTRVATITTTVSSTITKTTVLATSVSTSVTRSTVTKTISVAPTSSAHRVEISFASRSSVSEVELERVIKSAEGIPSTPLSFAYTIANAKLVTLTVTGVTKAFVELSSKVVSQPYSTTNVQVSGIDELDVVKASAKALFYSRGNSIYVIDAASDKLASVIKVPRYVRGIYVWGDRLVAICSGAPIRVFACLNCPPVFVPSSVEVLIYNVSDIRSPKLIANVTLSGYYLSSRMYKGVLYLLTQSPAYIEKKLVLPVVGSVIAKPSNIVVLTPGDTYLTVLALNVSSLKGKAYAYLINRASIVYMSMDHLYVISNMFGVYRVIPQLLEKYMKIVPRSLASRLSELMKSNRIAEAYTKLLKWVMENYDRAKAFVKEVEALIGKEGACARVFVFEVRGLDVEDKGYVDVPGVLTKQFAVNQLGNYLVLATVRYSISFEIYKPPVYTVLTAPTVIPITVYEQINGSTTTSVSYISITHSRTAMPKPRYYVYPRISLSSVGVYIIDVKNLRIVASIPRVITNEYVFGARLVGTTLFLVTNRRVDPLFAIDLSDPLKPKIVGYVKLPGYLTYLHPISKTMLLGMGVEKSSLKIEVFDVSDLRNLKEVSKLVIDKGWTTALYDYHAICFWYSRKLMMFPISISWRNVGAAIVSYDDGKLKLVKILELPGTVRIAWIGSKVFVISPSEIKVFAAGTWRQISIIKL